MTGKISTQVVHSGEARRKPHGAITTPIVQTSTFTFENTAAVLAFMERKTARTAVREGGGDLSLRDEYGRYSNPTLTAAEGKLAALEDADGAVLFATGMCAITTSMLSLLSAGDHAIVVRDTYRRTREFASSFLPRYGVETTLVPIGDSDALAEAIRPNTRLIFCETPTNPYLRIMDLAAVAELAHGHDIVTMVDSTFATPINLHPLELGIDLAIHSATKYLGGHNDLLAGVVMGRNSLVTKIQEARGLLGGMSGPNGAYLLIRGLKTLPLRVRQQNESAMRLALFLEGHAKVARVFYPGLESHPDHKTAVKQMTGFGGVVSFEVAADKAGTSRFIDALQIPYIGPTLGGVESIVQQQALFISLQAEDRRAAGVSDSLVRYAVGIEHTDDLIADLAQALAAV